MAKRQDNDDTLPEMTEDVRNSAADESDDEFDDTEDLNDEAEETEDEGSV